MQLFIIINNNKRKTIPTIQLQATNEIWSFYNILCLQLMSLTYPNNWSTYSVCGLVILSHGFSIFIHSRTLFKKNQRRPSQRLCVQTITDISASDLKLCPRTNTHTHPSPQVSVRVSASKPVKLRVVKMKVDSLI